MLFVLDERKEWDTMLHKTKHYWYKNHKENPPRLIRIRPSWYEKTAKEVWSASRVIRALSKKPQGKVSWFSRAAAFLSTPFKRLGVWGWKDTGCNGEAKGVLVRDAARSTDGFWTLDIELESFAIGNESVFPHSKAPRFIRIEVEPDTHAHSICEERKPKAGDVVRTVAPVVVDKDGPFLELHPDEAFRISKKGSSPKTLRKQQKKREAKIVARLTST
jgi:hypothetical protein